MFKSNSGFSEVIAVSLFLILVVVAILFFQTWFSQFQNNNFSNLELKTNFMMDNNIEIVSLNDDDLYIKSNHNNVLIKSVYINDIDCMVSDNLNVGMNKVNLLICLSQINSGKINVVVKTETDIYEKFFYIKTNYICSNNSILGFAGGIGTLLEPFQICNCKQLQNINLSLSSYYVLTGNINCGVNPYDTNKGFSPILNFNGSLNGNGYTINNLYINSSNDYVGLFGKIINNTKIENLNLINVNITGKDFVGGLVGCAYGNKNNSQKIQNIYVSGVIIGQEFVGGIIGSIGGFC